MVLKIDIFMSEICGSYHELRETLGRAIAELNIPAEVSYHTLSYDEAVSRNIKGSPSVWINGADLFPGGASPGIL